MKKIEIKIMSLYKIIHENTNKILFGTLITLIFSSLFVHIGQGPLMGSIDIVIFRVINHDLQNPYLNNLAAIASNIGTADLDILILLISILLVISAVSRNKELGKIAIILIISTIISLSVIYLLKTNFEVSRPYFYLNDIHVYCEGEWHNLQVPIVNDDKRNSFPSGHAIRMFMLLGVFWVYNRVKIILLICFILLSFFIVYTGVHYVSDVIIGGIIGFMIGYLVQKKLNRAYLKYGV